METGSRVTLVLGNGVTAGRGTGFGGTRNERRPNMAFHLALTFLPERFALRVCCKQEAGKKRNDVEKKTLSDVFSAWLQMRFFLFFCAV